MVQAKGAYLGLKTTFTIPVALDRLSVKILKSRGNESGRSEILCKNKLRCTQS